MPTTTHIRTCDAAGNAGPCNAPATLVAFDASGASDLCSGCAYEAEAYAGVTTCASPLQVAHGADVFRISCGVCGGNKFARGWDCECSSLAASS